MTVATESGKLQRVLRVRDGLAVTVGIVIGAGILGTPGLIAGYLGDPVTILAMWFFGGVVAGLSTLVLAEMAAALPEAGGKFVYARHAWGPTMGFVAGWSELLVTRGFSGASKAVLIATYIITLTGTGSVRILALAVVLGYFVLHTRGLKTSTTFQNVTTPAMRMARSMEPAPRASMGWVQTRMTRMARYSAMVSAGSTGWPGMRKGRSRSGREARSLK